jgi:hypothetical protein
VLIDRCDRVIRATAAAWALALGAGPLVTADAPAHDSPALLLGRALYAAGRELLTTEAETPTALRTAFVAYLATVPHARPLHDRIVSPAFDAAWLAGLDRLVRADVLTWAEEGSAVRCGPAALLRLLAHDIATPLVPS